MITIKSSVLGEAEKEIRPQENLPLLDQFEEAGIPLPFGCRAGSCGSCRVEVLEGRALLNEVGPMERDTLDRCGDPASVRLACRARFASSDVQGRVVLGKAKDL